MTLQNGFRSDGQGQKERDRDMRRNLMLALALAAVLSLGVAAIASAVSTTLRAGNLIVTFGATTSPKALPKTKYVAGHDDHLRHYQNERRDSSVGVPRRDLRHRQGCESQRQGLSVLQRRAT